MCTPMLLGIASFAMGAVQAVAQFQAQQQAHDDNQKAVEGSYKSQQQQLSLRQQQEQDALKQRLQQANIQEAQAAAETQVQGAASGFTGISLDNLVQDVSRRSAMNRETERTNTDMIVSQLKAEKVAAQSEADGRIASVQAPSALSLVAGIGSAAVGGFSTYTNAKNRM